MKTDEILQALRKSYEPYEEIAVSEIAKVDNLRATWEKTKDPEWLAFRDNPKTQQLFRASVNSYKSLYKQMANDDGTLTAMERKAMDVGKKWALWWIRALGGDPVKVKREIEKEISKFAVDIGIEI